MDAKKSELSPGGGSPADPQPQRSPAEIRHDIQRTRADLDATVDALERKLQPKRLAWEARRKVEPQVRQAGERVAHTAKDHRTTLLAGAGAVLGLLALRKLVKRRRGPGFPDEQKGL
jgi:hypothetical protein